MLCSPASCADWTGRVFSGAGNHATTTVHYTVRAKDTTKPAISITSPAAGARFVQGTTPYSRFRCTDSGSGIASCTGSKLATGLGGHAFTVRATGRARNRRVLLVVTHTP